jgi:hypothetical protein
MAAGSGFKTFATGDVLTAADTNGYLMQGVWVFADAAARTAAVTSPEEGNMSYLKDTNSTEYYSGSAWVALGGSAGKFIQLVSATTSTATTIATTSMTDTTITASITPTLATSKILVLVNYFVVHSINSAGSLIGGQLVRGATAIQGYANLGIDGTTATGATAVSRYHRGQLMYYDSPATTSATTYKVQGRVNDTANSGTSSWQNSSQQSSIILIEVGV